MSHLSRYANAIVADGVVVWHSVLGNPISIHCDTWELLKSGKFDAIDAEELSLLGSLGYIVEKDEPLDYFYSNIDKELSLGYNFEFLKTAFFIVTNACNLNCQYCMFRSLGGNSALHLSFEDFKKAMKSISSFFTRKDTPLIVTFSGGEPLLRKDFIVDCVAYLKSEYPSINFDFRILTNATLLNDEVAQFLKENNFHLHLSIDGLQSEHTKVRPFEANNHSRNSSFDGILRAVELVKKYKLDIGAIQVTLCEDNFELNPCHLLHFIKESFALDRISIEPDITLSAGRIPVDNIAEKLIAFWEEGNRQEIEITGFWLRPYLSLFENYLHKTRLTWCGATRGTGLVITPEGHWKTCAYLPDTLGNINDSEELIKHNWQSWCEKYRNEQRQQCQGCELEFLCMGGCLVSNRTFESSTYKCDLYKSVFKKLIRKHLEEE